MVLDSSDKKTKLDRDENQFFSSSIQFSKRCALGLKDGERNRARAIVIYQIRNQQYSVLKRSALGLKDGEQYRVKMKFIFWDRNQQH